MLIRVFASNILSFDKGIEFSLIPGKSSSKSDHIVRRDNRDDIPVLKTGVIYGANASGKSNLIKVMALIQNMATKSLTDIAKEIPVKPFKLNAKIGGYSKIEVEIKVDECNYAYGVKFNSKIIVNEWLVKINKRSEKVIFQRESSKDNTHVVFPKLKFKNKKDAQFAEFVGRGTSVNKTFLKECMDRNLKFVDAINATFTWFDDKLRVFFPKTRFRGMEFHLDDNADLANSMARFLNYFNTGVTDLRAKKIDYETDIENIPADVINELIDDLENGKRALIGSNDNRISYAFERNKKGNIEAYKLVTLHKNKQGKNIEFEMVEESDGTRRLIDFIPMLVDLAKNDSVYLIDEIDRSMHPILTKGIMEFFLTIKKATKGQMIVTTHESNLLNLDLLRNDEIWFVEKNKKGSSHFYSLLEFKPRNDKDIKKGYLNGRFGAIPFLTNPCDLNW